MSLRFHRSTSAPSQPGFASIPLSWEKLRDLSQLTLCEWEPSTWVKVFNPPTAFSFDEALLLCQTSENQWLAWIPDHGEVVLHTDEFCHLVES
ncbi:MAG: hypothetical protein OHK0047_17960 [Leptolyngbyaceae cyanobacterium]